MYYVSRGSESWAHFHGEEGNKSPMSQLERVQLAWAPHLTANYSSSSSKSLLHLSKAHLAMHSLLLASLDVQLTECSSHFLPSPSSGTKTLASKTVQSCSTLYHCNDIIIAVKVFTNYYIYARKSATLLLCNNILIETFCCCHKWGVICAVLVLFCIIIKISDQGPYLTSTCCE